MISLNINNKKVDVEVDENMPLLWTLRDIIGLTGTKFGCGKGLCGACTILVDGDPIRSCITPISYAITKKITTIEGVEDINKTIQKVWDDLNVAQCGYCQPGQIISTVALLNENKNPTDSDIDDALSGNICRCGTYVRIREAIHKTAEIINTKSN